MLQEQKFKEASEEFKSAYKSEKPSPSLLYNWGLAAYKSQQPGLAVGLWRKALSLNPDLSVAREALNFYERNSPSSPFAQDVTLWHQIKSKVLSRASLNKFLVLTWLFLVAFGFLFIRYLGTRRKALRDNLPGPQWPMVATVFCSLFALALILSVGKFITLFEVHATIIAQNVPMRTGPSDEDNILFELAEGQDVEVRQVTQNWILVSIESGASGWIPKNVLLQHSGSRQLW